MKFVALITLALSITAFAAPVPVKGKINKTAFTAVSGMAKIDGDMVMIRLFNMARTDICSATEALPPLSMMIRFPNMAGVQKVSNMNPAEKGVAFFHDMRKPTGLQRYFLAEKGTFEITAVSETEVSGKLVMSAAFFPTAVKGDFTVTICK
jgi:hypothetical protein